jgi:DNA-binding MarR family transcriptional regulator
MSKASRIQKKRTETLGWLLGYGFGLIDHLVIDRVAHTGHPGFRGGLGTLMKAMPPSGEAPMTELVARARVTKQAMSQLVAKAQSHGYVMVRVDPDDRRARLVSYSKKGTALVAEIVRTAQSIERSVQRRLGLQGMKELRGRLKEAIAALEGELERATKTQ